MLESLKYILKKKDFISLLLYYKNDIDKLKNIYFLYSKSDTNDVFFEKYLFGA